jgi:hypothetical protein
MSTVDVCTRQLGSCSKNKYNLQEQTQVGWSTQEDQWPLSLQQHAAGLLVSNATLYKKTPQASSLVCQSLNLQKVQNLQLALQPWLLAQD